MEAQEEVIAVEEVQEEAPHPEVVHIREVIRHREVALLLVAHLVSSRTLALALALVMMSTSGRVQAPHMKSS